MTDYTEQQLQQMQQEAIERVHEMQRRAQQTAQQQGWVGSALPPPSEKPPSEPPPQQPPPQPAPPVGFAPLAELFRGQGGSPLSALVQWAGGERGILLALLAVLLSEGADPTLLLALFYLAMFDDPAETK